MINILTIIIASSCIGVTFAELSGIPNSIKNWLKDKRIWYRKGVFLGGEFIEGVSGAYITKRIKPFDCGLCLSFWISLSLCYFKAGQPLLESIGYASISAVLAVWIVKITKP
jgi:hypothetical protein